MSRYATVSRLYEAGFPVGGDPGTRCKCGHLWGGHELHPFDDRNPMKGGTATCPLCESCFNTWGVDPKATEGRVLECPRCHDIAFIPKDSDVCPGCINERINRKERGDLRRDRLG